jgi:hypothetical protein
LDGYHNRRFQQSHAGSQNGNGGDKKIVTIAKKKNDSICKGFAR